MLDIAPLYNKTAKIGNDMFTIKGGFLRDGKLILIVAICDNTVSNGMLMEMPLINDRRGGIELVE